MDRFTADQWEAIKSSDAASRSRVADTVLDLLCSLETIVDGFPVDQLTHACQAATRAERSGAEPELVVAALCHDLGKGISSDNHGTISAEILKPYVSRATYEVVRTHQDFQVRHYGPAFGRDPELRERYRHEPWFSIGETFADEWDQRSFDPDYDTLPLEHFEPLVRAVFS
ncbi:MAG: HD domain-containing protein [Actinomycetota bacterium]|nr:HD domain-containing protein [Actinomycetota bacterium]